MDKTATPSRRFPVVRWPQTLRISGAIGCWVGTLSKRVTLVLCFLITLVGARGGEFGLLTSSTAPATVIEGLRSALLRISASNPGIAGSPAVELTSIRLRLESIAGVPITLLAGASFVSAIELFADTNGSGGFEPAMDKLVATVIAPTTATDGALSVTFENTNPVEVRIGSGQTKDFFVIVRFAADAAVQTPHTLRLTHVTTGPAASTAREVGTALPLALVSVPDVSTPVITVISNTPPTTSGIANRFSFAPSNSVNIQLPSVFQDLEDAAGGLRFDIAAIGNPALFSFAGIDSLTGSLMLDFAPGVRGSSDFTIRATDSAGKTVSASSSVTFAPFASFADWAAFQARGGSSVGTAGAEGGAFGGVSNFMKYAFGLDPLDAGDRGGLPRLERIGNALVVTHLKPKYATDVAYSYEISDDLATWVPAFHGEHFFQNSKELSDGRLRVDSLLLGKSERTFLRVRAQALLVNYSDWAAFHFGGGAPNGSAAGDDPQGRGMTNFAKYAFALDPHDAGDRAGLLRLDKVGSAWVLTHLRPKHATDLAYTYEISTDLAAWEPAISGVHFQQRTTDLAEGRVREELQLLVGWPRAFLRVRANQLAPAVPTPGGELGNAPATVGSVAPESTVMPPSAVASGPAGSGVGHPIHGTAIFLQETVLTTAAAFANAVAVADLDGDGFPDVLSASLTDNKVAWYRNNGDGSFSAQQIITTQNVEPSAIAAADLDGDGKPDVITGSHFPFPNGILAWHKNLGGGNFGPQQIISNGYAYITSISVADLDNDGKPDVVCTGLFDNQIAWNKNLGGGLFGANQIIGVLSGPNSAKGPYQAVVADIDGDGLPDVVSASSTDNKIAWYRNNGGGVFGAQQVISTAVIRASTVAAADFDGDGRIDVIAGGANDNTVSFFKNMADGTFGSRVVLTSEARGVFSVIAADINGDGAPEVISASIGDGMIAWHDNLGAGSFGPRQSISTSALGAVAAAVGDFNGDGVMDVVSASQSDSKIAAYLNTGSQASIATVSIAPSEIREGSQSGVLRIALTNQGQPGNNNARLGRLVLLFEVGPGMPLTTTQANEIIDSVQVFSDANGSGTFEAASDPLVQTIPFLSLNSGVLEVPLPEGSPHLNVPPGATRSFIVVVTMNANATTQGVSTFRITNRTTGAVSTNAKDAVSGAILAVATGGDGASTLVTVVANQQPVAIGIPSITVFDTNVATTIPLRSYFNDPEDGANGLTFAIIGNSKPNLFSFSGINPANGVLQLKFRTGIPGTAQLTIKATDRLGKSVSTIVGVNVQLIASLSDWENRYGGGNSLFAAGANSNLLRYAFGMNPGIASANGGLPQLRSVGNARLLSYSKPKYASDVGYHVEISSDLINWSPANHGDQYFEITTDMPNALQRRDLVILVDWPQAFLRVRADLIP